VDTQGDYYIRAYNIHECYADSSIHVTVNPLPTLTVTINNRDTATCSDVSVAFDLSTMASMDNGGDELQFCLDKDFASPISSLDMLSYSVNPDDTLRLYVRALNTATGCVTADNAIDSVRIIVHPIPTVTAIPQSDFLCNANDFKIDVSVGNRREPLGYEWQLRNNLTGVYGGYGGAMAPGGTGSFTQPVTTFTYVPSTADRNNDSIVLRLTATTAVCGSIVDSVTLFMTSGNPGALFQIVDQPIGLQVPCEDTTYYLKITETGDGGLTNIRVDFNDWRATGMQLKSVEYLYPMDGTGSWRPMDIEVGEKYFQTRIPASDEIVLERGDSLLIKQVVHPECGFYSGSDYLFHLFASNTCNTVNMPSITLTADKFNLDFGLGHPMPDYYISATFDKTVIKNVGGNSRDEHVVTCIVEYVLNSGVPDFSKEK
jgi:hypothetical protein